ncbi:MAG: tRNA threonylcarbamoyladenosine biosynthesis protein TsaB [Paraglaciecola sp.]|jgi:tRNA threonylcarbamoyladenosine biosynthesis protein TsaB
MNLLVIDTATEACSVALEIGGKVFSRFEICPQQHSQRLLPMVDEVLKEADIKLSQLDYLGFGHGPGSFTGVRIATGMIQGLALGCALPVVGISTLAAMAQQAIMGNGATEVSCAIDARIGEVYFARYVENNNVAKLTGEEQVLVPALAAELLSANQTIGVGTGWQAYPELNIAANVNVTKDILYPNAIYMLPLLKHAIANGEARDIEQIQPVYLRDKVTWKKLPGRE